MSTAILHPTDKSMPPADDPAPRSDDRALGAILRAARQRRGLTLRQVARHMGITHGAVAHWESGYNRPTIPTRIDLAQLYDVSFAELVPEAAEPGQVTVTDPQQLLLLAAFERVPAGQRDTLLSIVLGAADRLAGPTA